MKRMKHILFFALLCFAFGNASAETNYNVQSKTPIMGWSSWNTFRININEDLIKETADAMVEKGLKDAGYTFINIDDGFFAGRDDDGKLNNNDQKFPGGMRAIADYIHGKGLKAGIYSEAGDKTCAYYWDGDTKNGLNVGLYGYEEQDAKTYFDEWDFDFIKIDYCGAEYLGLDEETQYTKIWNAIRNTDKVKNGGEIRWNICRWMFPGTWAAKIADSWRVTHDIYNEFDTDRGVRGILEQNLYLSAYASSGHSNDMDMMQIGRGTFTEDEEKSHFGLWCIMNSPLMIGCDLRSISQNTIDIITNKEVIAINQDRLGLQARLVNRDGKQFVLAKDIEQRNGTIRAVALFNCESSAKTMRINFAGIQLTGKIKVRDLWKQENIGEFEDYYEVEVPSHGIAMLRIEGESSFNKTVYEGENAYMNEYNEVKIDKGTYDGARFSYKFGASGNYILSDLGGRESNWAEFNDIYMNKGGKFKFKLFYYSDSDKELTVTINDTEYKMTNLNSGGKNKRGRAFIDEITLDSGTNTIRFSNLSASTADIDKFVILDVNDPGDDDEPDYEIDEEIIVNTKFPTISSEDDSDETWYYIQFRNQYSVLQDMGDNANILTAQKMLNIDDQLWKVTGTEGNYTIVNKSGRKIDYANSRFTSSSESSINLNIVASTNTTYAPAWEIQRVGASGCMNQWGGAGVNKELGEWTKGDVNNPLLFVAAEKSLNYMPEISTGDKEVWYYIKFKKGGNVLQSMGVEENLTIQSPVENKEEQLWKIKKLEGNYYITNKSGGIIEFSNNFYKVTLDKFYPPLLFKFIFTQNEDWAPAWELQRSGEDNMCLNQYQNTNVGQPISEWYLGDGGNMLNFYLPSEMGFDEPIEGFPEISINDNEKWYYIQFKNGNGVLQDMGEDENMSTKGITTNDAQHWKVIQTNNTAPYIYQIVNKSGRSINHVSSTETSDGLYQTTGNASSATNFNIIESTNTIYVPALELQREGSSRYMNQYKGAGIDRLISEWNKGDGGNPLIFVPIEDAEIIRAEMPEISTDEKEVWYYISFFDVEAGKTAYLTDAGGETAVVESQLITEESVADNGSQMWKVIFSQKIENTDYYKFVSKTGRAIFWNEEKYMANSEDFTNIRFNELAPYWILEREGGSDGQGMSQTAPGPDKELYDTWNTEGYGRLTFIKVDEGVSIPDIKSARSYLIIENKQLFVKGNQISRVNIFSTTGQLLQSKTNTFRFSFVNSGCYIVSIVYNDGLTENKKVIMR